ncbi:collagen alpha-1(I) chain-like [Haemorhous mexicanus]|uniref:collagen alpha-1(I) chain-like n=1 Tax=Haemorhous mexicanus TaxID=30427 RepID=UPI0028BF4DAA|nr:collagen alpha-1(I) chain-like [Haemorhous mexicanus]
MRGWGTSPEGPGSTPDSPRTAPPVTLRCRALLNPTEERGPGGVPARVAPGGPAARPRLWGCPPPSPPTPRRAAVPLNGGAAPVAEGAVAVADITRGREHLRPARLRHRHRHRSAPGRAGTGAGAGRPRRPPRYAARRTGPVDGDTGTHRDPLRGWDGCRETPASVPGPPETGPAALGPPVLYRDLPNPPGASSRRGTPAPGSAAPHREGTPPPPTRLPLRPHRDSPPAPGPPAPPAAPGAGVAPGPCAARPGRCRVTSPGIPGAGGSWGAPVSPRPNRGAPVPCGVPVPGAPPFSGVKLGLRGARGERTRENGAGGGRTGGTFPEVAAAKGPDPRGAPAPFPVASRSRGLPVPPGRGWAAEPGRPSSVPGERHQPHDTGSSPPAWSSVPPSSAPGDSPGPGVPAGIPGASGAAATGFDTRASGAATSAVPGVTGASRGLGATLSPTITEVPPCRHPRLLPLALLTLPGSGFSPWPSFSSTLGGSGRGERSPAPLLSVSPRPGLPAGSGQRPVQGSGEAAAGPSRFVREPCGGCVTAHTGFSGG